MHSQRQQGGSPPAALASPVQRTTSSGGDTASGDDRGGGDSPASGGSHSTVATAMRVAPTSEVKSPAAASSRRRRRPVDEQQQHQQQQGSASAERPPPILVPAGRDPTDDGDDDDEDSLIVPVIASSRKVEATTPAAAASAAPAQQNSSIESHPDGVAAVPSIPTAAAAAAECIPAPSRSHHPTTVKDPDGPALVLGWLRTRPNYMFGLPDGSISHAPRGMTVPFDICPDFLKKKTGCPRGSSCDMAHVDLAKARQYTPHVRDTLWRSRKDVPFDMFAEKGSRIISIRSQQQQLPSSSAAAAVVDRVQLRSCLKTAIALGSKAPTPPSHCAHWLLKNECGYGSKCRFIHCAWPAPAAFKSVEGLLDNEPPASHLALSGGRMAYLAQVNARKPATAAATTGGAPPPPPPPTHQVPVVTVGAKAPVGTAGRSSADRTPSSRGGGRTAPAWLFGLQHLQQQQQHHHRPVSHSSPPELDGSMSSSNQHQRQQQAFPPGVSPGGGSAAGANVSGEAPVMMSGPLLQRRLSAVSAGAVRHVDPQSPQPFLPAPEELSSSPTRGGGGVVARRLMNDDVHHASFDERDAAGDDTDSLLGGSRGGGAQHSMYTVDGSGAALAGSGSSGRDPHHQLPPPLGAPVALRRSSNFGSFHGGLPTAANNDDSPVPVEEQSVTHAPLTAFASSTPTSSRLHHSAALGSAGVDSSAERAACMSPLAMAFGRQRPGSGDGRPAAGSPPASPTGPSSGDRVRHNPYGPNSVTPQGPTRAPPVA